MSAIVGVWVVDNSASPLPFQLDVIARSIEGWLEWHSDGRASEGLTTEDGTHIMALPVPVWPSHGMFRNWIEVLRSAAQAIEARSDETRSGSAEGKSAVPQGCAKEQTP